MEYIVVVVGVLFVGFIAGICEERNYSEIKSFFVGVSVGALFTLLALSIGISKRVLSGVEIEHIYLIKVIGAGVIMSLVMGFKCTYPNSNSDLDL